MNQEYVNGRWQIRLDDGTVIRDNAAHCICPVAQAAGFVGFSKVGPSTKVSVYEKAANKFYDLDINGTGVCYGVTDGRYLVLGMKVAQGKNDLPQDLAAAIFDTQAKAFLNFSGLPTLQVFRTVGSGQRPNFLWVKNGRQVGGFEGTDPQGVVIDVSFPAPNLIGFQLAAADANGLTTQVLSLSRTIDLTTGAMGPIA